jgi:hypothetical protein
MISYYLLKELFPQNETVTLIVYFAFTLFVMIRVRCDCKLIDESFLRHFLLIVFLPLLFALFWFIVWPGSLRLKLKGKSIADTDAAKTFKRYKSH